MGKDEEVWDYYFRALMFRENPRDRWDLEWKKWNLDFLGGHWWQYEQQGFGRFCCSWCGHSWDSIHVWILCQTKLENRRRRGTVKMKISRQKCNRCCASIYEDPEFTVENINIILNNLLTAILESCYGEDVDDETQPIIMYGSLDGPHQPENCEACQLGICARNPCGKGSSRKTSPAKSCSCQCTREPAPPIHVTIPEPCADQSKGQPACGSCLWKCCGFSSLILIILLLIKIMFHAVT